ncbi:MAG TPA: substrate-binding domain-containing protein [Candidatus Avipropionibacterium avicola]|uniref:Substrate-binding domain-containing protein n=1 Tax=Candidatus Avipropionibacterium avicola TaxID=2840701 RepID=A0A9D1KLY0_9ACTN|nr:substrate-binding domain-containing protein [Candidatus Avipropionibacterium avicola]
MGSPISGHRTDEEVDDVAGKSWRRTALREQVLSSIRSGVHPPGAKLPSLRTLGNSFGLSPPTVLDELRDLIADGTLVSVPGTGIFVAEDRLDDRPVFLLVHPSWPDQGELHRLTSVRLGFEETLSELGGATLSIDRDDLAAVVAAQPRPAIAGILSRAPHARAKAVLEELDVPQVRIGPRQSQDQPGPYDQLRRYDTVDLDNHAGGRLAAEHLLRRGCSRIAFLALHADDGQDVGHLRFSEERLLGWLATMTAAGRDPAGLAFHPDRNAPDYEQAVLAAERTAERMVAVRERYDAVIAADDNAVLAFAEAWHRCGLPDADLPAIVGFEDVEAARGYVTSSIIPQWRELGEQAARLLWGRHLGHLSGPPVHRAASMRFVARITAERDWLGGARRRLVRRHPPVGSEHDPAERHSAR